MDVAGAVEEHVERRKLGREPFDRRVVEDIEARAS
jgi:hypothetical protein